MEEDVNLEVRQRADELFDASLEVPVEERQAFVDERAAGAPELRAEVSRLLRLVGDEAPALDGGWAWSLLPAAVRERDGEDDTRIGEVIGAWRIVRLIGRGGMGSVYLVERSDGQFAQTAALKLVRPGLDTELITRRFERERQIVASLAHTCIARLLDGGRTSDGRPYFVMEHVEGGPIDEYCDEHRLTIEERLGLFERVCAPCSTRTASWSSIATSSRRTSSSPPTAM